MISYWERLLDGSETVLGPFEHGTWWFWERLLAKWERQLAKWERHLDQFEYGTCPSYSSGTNLIFFCRCKVAVPSYGFQNEAELFSLTLNHFQYIHVKYIQTAFLLIKDRIDSRHGLTPAGNYLIWQLLTPAGVKSFLEAMVIVMKTILSGLHIFFFFTLGPKGRKGIVITFVCLSVCLCVCVSVRMSFRRITFTPLAGFIRHFTWMFLYSRATSEYLSELSDNFWLPGGQKT